MPNEPFDHIMLGRPQAYVDQYDATLLHSIPRSASRSQLQLAPFVGVDIWTAYELSWLVPSGKPEIAIAELSIPAATPNLIESKSLKYYLNSFNQTVYPNRQFVLDVISKDLSNAAGGAVTVRFFTLPEYAQRRLNAGEFGECIDAYEISGEMQSPASALAAIRLTSGNFDGVVYSHLLKSNCPVTGQPDWASIWLGWRGPALKWSDLLQYLIAYRQHQDFHENCVESIYCDLFQRFSPSRLWVYARYTRRGGLDINPFRSSVEMEPPLLWAARQ